MAVSMMPETIEVALFNLVAYLPKNAKKSPIGTLVSGIIDKLPSRTISIHVSDDAEEKLTLQRYPRLIERAGKRISCASVQITAGSASLACVPFALMPYLMPDLPIYLLWDQDPLLDTVVLPPLKKFATRLIFNAINNGQDRWKHFSQEMLSNLKNFQIEILDIQWAMVGGWRDALVRLFNTPLTLQQLRHCQRLSLSFCGKDSSEATQSLYLSSWLAAQLGWKLTHFTRKSEEIIASYAHSQGHVHVTMQAACTDDKELTGTVLSMKMDSYDGVNYSLQRHGDRQTVVVHVGRKESCDLAFYLPLPALDKRLSYIKELFHNTSGAHYTNMLNQLALMP